MQAEDTSAATYSCLSPDEIQSREQYGCPVCLAAHTEIATPDGPVAVTNLAPGMLVWSVDQAGSWTTQPVRRITRVRVPEDHVVVRLELSDGRVLRVSPGHPIVGGGVVDDLRVGEIYDGSAVVSAERESYAGAYTYDLLPAGATGLYVANGVLLGSTLAR